jgi:prevent-host-death family protein
MRMSPIDTYVSVTEAKKRLLDIVRRLGRADGTVAITREGIPAAVLLSMRRFEELTETLEILSDARAMSSLRRSLKQAAQGKWARQEEVFPGKES